MKQTTLTIAEATRQIKELQRHIEALQKQPEEVIRQSIADSDLPNNVYGKRVIIEKRDDVSDEWVIRVPLPAANTNWTLEAFEWVKTYVTKQHEKNGFSCFPVHESRNKPNYLYICIRF